MKLFSRLANKIDNASPPSEFKCTVRLLDDTETLTCDFTKDTKGQAILDFVCQKLDLLEKDYFGLRFMENNKQRHWLDPIKNVLRQFRSVNPYVLCFRVRFYPPNPELLQEEITRYYLFLQMRRDLLHGRLFTNQADGPALAAYILQSEIGDAEPLEHPTPAYISHHKLLMKQTPKIEENILECHKLLKGQVPSVAELNFLQKGSELETYGIDPYPVKDQKGNHMYLGINHEGIMTFQSNNKVHHFKWDEIRKIEFEGKMLVIHLLIDGHELCDESIEYFLHQKKHVCGFKCPTQGACKHVWKCGIEQRDFFKLKSSEEIKVHHSGGGIFSRGSKYRYSGRVEKEISQAGRSSAPRIGPPVIRKPSFKEPPRKKGGTYFSDKAKPVTYHSPKVGDRSLTSSNSDVPKSPTTAKDVASLSNSPDSAINRGTSEKWISTPETNTVPPKRPKPPTSPTFSNTEVPVSSETSALLDSSLSFDEIGSGDFVPGLPVVKRPSSSGSRPPSRPPPPRPFTQPLKSQGESSKETFTPEKYQPMESPYHPTVINNEDLSSPPLPKSLSEREHVPVSHDAKSDSNVNGGLLLSSQPSSHYSVKANASTEDRLLDEANLEMVKLQEDKTNHLPGPNVKLRLLNDSLCPSPQVNSKQEANSSNAGPVLGIANYLNDSFTGLRKRIFGDNSNALPGTVQNDPKRGKASPPSFSDSPYYEKLIRPVSALPQEEQKRIISKDLLDSLDPAPSRYLNQPPSLKHRRVPFTLASKLMVALLLLVLLGVALILLMESDNPNTRYLFRKYHHLSSFHRNRYIPAKKEVYRAWQRVCALRK